MWRHAESNNIVLLADFLEFKRVVALMAVNYKQAIGAYYTILYMGVKML